MKNTTIRTALFVLGFALFQAAHAQSSVTVYGIADLGVEYIDHLPAADGSVLRLRSGAKAGSRLGFRGSEDLGGGMRAFFTLESGIAIDTGELMQGGRVFGRLAYVGLAGGWGELSLGRHRNAIFDVAVPFDPIGYGHFSLLSVDPAVAARVDNAVRYRKSIGALALSAQYSFGYDAKIPGGAEVADNAKVGREVGVSAVYTNGAIATMLAYDQRQGVTIATQNQDERRLVAAGTYDFGRWKAYLGLIHLDRSLTPTLKRHTYWTGVDYKITPRLALGAALYKHDVRGKAADSRLYALSAAYSLSKRSQVYTKVGFASNDAGATQGVLAPATAMDGQAQQGVVVGIIHFF